MTWWLPYPVFAGLLLVLALYGAARVRWPGGRGISVAGLVAGLGVWLAATVIMTMRIGAGGTDRLNLVPFQVDSVGTVRDWVLNAGVFVPPGLLLAALGWRLVAVLGAGLAVSLGIEIAQYAFDIGRSADINDVLTNTLGAGLGWAIAWGIRRGIPVRSSRRRSRSGSGRRSAAPAPRPR